ncbi:GNAT family N-acetyltransferase [Sporomusa acidovorans]|uniref:N-acetyltransferase domain-containing protein n=1 Tax=Sporomusa acidovorans (strain ATCC 49682 / DSM 3132 / Mol) TaxID=1123286 RepID=A0ABZ3J1B0_SPOA4|nr:GNAT family N-acetyltransferase [Sporomusa acidovorans]OZC24163.1 acetyltransferase (GNAT) family protein [Sporomusa acidovorans DSM 3132]SDF37727.1 Acetyltransferase (GNAT) domain-containing protein [Sporomusa acidovorans]
MSINKQSQQLSITRVACQDWPVIKKMFAAAFEHDIYFVLMKRRLRLAQIFSCLSAKMSALLVGNVYLLRSDNEPAGFLILKKLGDKQMHLHYIAVAPEFRGQGLGRELTAFAINIAQECDNDIYSGAIFLVLSGAKWTGIGSAWLRNRVDYVTMIKKYQPL